MTEKAPENSQEPNETATEQLDAISAGRRGQDGNDLLIWNNGDGSDFLEGGEGFDFVQVNGSN